MNKHLQIFFRTIKYFIIFCVFIVILVIAGELLAIGLKYIGKYAAFVSTIFVILLFSWLFAMDDA